MAVDRPTKKVIRELEDRVEQLSGELEQCKTHSQEQAVELAAMGKAGLEIRKEDVQQLAEYKESNRDLIEFTQEIADSKSKFAKRAKEILGL